MPLGLAITTLAWPGGSLPEGAFHDPAALQGRVVRTSLARGEPILASKLAPVGARGGLAAAIGVYDQLYHLIQRLVPILAHACRMTRRRSAPVTFQALLALEAEALA